MVWHPSGEDTQVASIMENQLVLWDVQANSSKVQVYKVFFKSETVAILVPFPTNA